MVFRRAVYQNQWSPTLSMAIHLRDPFNWDSDEIDILIQKFKGVSAASVITIRY